MFVTYSEGIQSSNSVRDNVHFTHIGESKNGKGKMASQPTHEGVLSLALPVLMVTSARHFIFHFYCVE